MCLGSDYKNPTVLSNNSPPLLIFNRFANTMIMSIRNQSPWFFQIVSVPE